MARGHSLALVDCGTNMAGLTASLRELGKSLKKIMRQIR